MEILETNPCQLLLCALLQKFVGGKATNIGVTLASQFQGDSFLHGSGC